MNWYIGMKVIMKKMDYNEDGKQIDQVDPGLTSNPRIILMMYNFDNDYSTAKEKIVKNCLEFCAKGSGWIFELIFCLYILWDMNLHHKKLQRKKQMRENMDKKSLRKCFD